MRTRMLMVLLLIGVLLVPGCKLPWTTSEERINSLEVVVGKTKETLKNIEVDIVQIRAVIESTKLLLQETGLDEETKISVAAVLTKAGDELEKSFAKKAEVEVALAEWEADLAALKTDQKDLGEELMQYGTGASTLGGFIPVAGPWIVLLGSIATAVGAVLKAWKKGQKDKSILTSVAHSVDAVLDNLDDVQAAAAKTILKKKQTTEARTAIKAILIN